MAKTFIYVNSWINYVYNRFNHKDILVDRPLYPHEKGLITERKAYTILSFDLVPHPGFKVNS